MFTQQDFVKNISQNKTIQGFKKWCKDNFTPQQKQFLKLVNDFRAQNGRPPLKLSETLCKGTQAHANWMSNAHSMTHANLAQVGRNGNYKGFVNTENIAAGQKSVFDAFQAWVHSPGHRANLLANAKDLGFAYKNGYWSMNTGVSKV